MIKAVIMAGGFGTRMRPLTLNVPKPMIPVRNYPIMAHTIELLKKYEINDVLSLLYYQPDKIKSYFKDGSDFGIKMKYVSAVADYGTAGSVKNASDKIDETFLIISGDVVTDFDLQKAILFHYKSKSKATIVLTKISNPLQYGIVITDKDGRIEKFLEKPSWGQVFSDTINTGIYILEPEILDLIPEEEEFDFSKDLFPLMLEKNIPLFGYVLEGYWKDVGSLDEYQNIQLDILFKKINLNYNNNLNGLNLDNANNKISDSAKLHNSILGKGVSIGENVKLSNTIIGNNVKIKSNTNVYNSTIWNDCIIGSYSDITDNIICSNVTIGDNVTLQENVYISDNCHIGDRVVVTTNVKIWHNKVIENGAILFRSITQNETWVRHIFTDARISGSSNLDISPEFSSKLGSALGMMLGAGSIILASRDPDKVSRLIKRSIISGLLSVGVNVNDLQKTSIPQARQELRTGKNNAGFHVRRSPRNINQIDIIFLAEDGRDITISMAKKIERYFFGEEIKRVHFDNVGSLTFPERTNEIYIQRYFDKLNIDSIKKKNFKILVDYSFGLVSTTFPNILGQMNVAALSLHDYLNPINYNYNSNDEKKEIRAIMKSLDYNLGFLIDRGSEKISIVDNDGNHINNRRLLTIICKLYLEADKIENEQKANSFKKRNKIALTIVAPSEIEQIALEYGVDIIRIKNSHSAMMEVTRDKDIGFVGGIYGGFIFPNFLFAADAMFTIGKILEMLAITGYSIKELNRKLPKIHTEEIEIECPWDKKATLMRNILEYTQNRNRELIEGVKVIEKEYSILFIPEKEKSIFKIYIESHKFELIEKLKKEYKSLAESWIKE